MKSIDDYLRWFETYKEYLSVNKYEIRVINTLTVEELNSSDDRRNEN